jgi:hypothetical protein
MGLTGKFIIPDSDLEVKNAYLSLYDSTLTVQVLPESSLMRKIYEEKTEAPPNFYEAGGEDGKYTITGSVNIYATQDARKANKSRVGNYDMQIIVKEMDKPIPEIIYNWLKNKYPKLKDCI